MHPFLVLCCIPPLHECRDFHVLLLTLGSLRHSISTDVSSMGCLSGTTGLCGCRYPGEIIPGLLYLGNWEHAEDFAALKDLGVKK